MCKSHLLNFADICTKFNGVQKYLLKLSNRVSKQIRVIHICLVWMYIMEHLEILEDIETLLRIQNIESFSRITCSI